jgi:putative transcriptional regulator
MRPNRSTVAKDTNLRRDCAHLHTRVSNHYHPDNSCSPLDFCRRNDYCEYRKIRQSICCAERRMTLTELAERVDITVANLSILKTGKAKAIRFSTLEAVCKALQCQPGDLLVVKEDVTDA